jgi:putative ABC transport system permease protein
MEPIHFTFKSIAGNLFRNGIIFICVGLVAAFSVLANLVIQGAQENMKLSLANMSRLEADVVVFPTKSAFNNTGMEFMDFKGLLGELSVIPGVAAVSPQLRLSTITDSQLCQKCELYIIAFDPATDFSILSRLSENEANNFGINKAIAGSLVINPTGKTNFSLAGSDLKLIGQLPQTGLSIDQSLFVSFETALEVARNPNNQNEKNPKLALDAIPVILVKTSPGSDPHEVVRKILAKIPWITVMDSQSFFHLGRANLTSLLNNIPSLLGMIWILSVVCIGMVFSIAINARRREIGVLRVLGSSRSFIFRSLIIEGFVIAFAGGAAGILISTSAAALFREKLMGILGLPLAYPNLLTQFRLIAVIIALIILSVFLAALFPAWRITRQDPAILLRK